MRSSTAYLAGAGTVVIAIAAGLGGGLVIADIMSPHAKQELSKVERRVSPEPSVPATRDPLVPVPYLAATQAASSGPVVVSPAPSEAANSSQPTAQAPAASTPAAPAPTITALNDQAAQPPDMAKDISKDISKDNSEDSAKPETPNPRSSAVQPVTLREQSAPDDADAKARDADMKRAERKKAERRQQWSDRRRTPANRDQELRDVEQQVRASTEARAYDARSYEERPVRVEAPQIRLFGGDD
jgi:hypothetical protein